MVSSMVILALASAVAALEVTSPSSSSVWTVGESQTITWDYVSTDEDSFSVYLSNMVEYPSVSTLLASDVSSSDGSLTIDGSKLSAGDSFTINFTNDDKTEQIYAQSNQFNITEGSTSSSSSSASASSTSASSASSSSSGTASTTTTATTLAKTTSASSVTTGGAATATDSAGANHSNNGTASATGSSTASSSTATGTSASSASASGTASGTSASASSTSSSTATSGAGKIVAGWMGVIAVAAMVL